MTEKNPQYIDAMVNVTDRQRRNKDGAGFLLSTTALVCIILGFVCTILFTAAITYSLTYDAYYLEIELDRDEGNTPHKVLPIKAHPRLDNIANDEVDIRLPTDLLPIQYVVKLQPFMDQVYNYTFTGQEVITFYVANETTQVVFHLNDIIIDESSIKLSSNNGTNTDDLTFIDISYDLERQFFIGTLNDSLESDVTYNMSMNFSGHLNNDLAGFYRSVYQDENGDDDLIATTQFEATDARRAFPCFDEPAMKAMFEIHILREGVQKQTISNMPIFMINLADPPWDGWYWDVFENSLKMSSYLVAFVVSDFTNILSNKNDHVGFRVWTRPAAIDDADYALSIGPDILTFYEEFFNITFPLPKIDMVALPDFDAGAMENWGLITYRETALLFDPLLAGASNKQRVGEVVAHELAHQWFGDLVTPVWWTYLWLNEGFASYMEYAGLDSVQSDFKMLDQFPLLNNQRALSSDSLESSHPIYIVVNNPNEILEIIDDITYNKGASIIRMTEFFLKTETFKAGLTNYLNGLAYSVATQDDLWYYLTLQGEADGTLPQNVTVKMIMDTWTKLMNYPVITVTRSENGTTANVTQERFLLVKNESSVDPIVYMWWVPLTFTTEDSPDFIDTYPQQWMTNEETFVEVDVQAAKDKWVIFNIQSGSYYRVNYDDGNWGLLIQQLVNDLTAIGLVNRAQIIDDAMNLARGGFLSYDVSLDINSYLSQETEYVPWSSALNNLNYLEEMFTRTASYGAMKEYILDLLVPFYNTTHFEDNLSEPHLQQLSRVLVTSWACHLGYEPCVDSSTTLYAQWMADPENLTIISPNVKETVYCTGIAEGDLVEWDFAYDRYLNSNLATDKDYLLTAMGCSKEIWILVRYLDMAFTEEYGIRKQDSRSVFHYVANNDIGRDIAWEYLQEHWYHIAEYYVSNSSVANLVTSVSNEFNTELKLTQLEDLMQEHSEELGSATQSFDQAIETVQNNIVWMDNYYAQIKEWLIDHGYGDMGRYKPKKN